MRVVLSELELLGLTTTSATGQRIIARGGVERRRCVAANPNLDGAVANVLATDTDLRTRQHSLLRATDPEVLAEACNGVRTATWALRNTNTPEACLVAAARSQDERVVYGALLNPNTPLETRRRRLRPKSAWRLVNLENSVPAGMRAFELVAANPWILETQERWTPRIQRGVTGLVEVEAGQYRRHASRRTFYRFEAHPSLRPDAVEDCETKHLLGDAHPAVDRYLIEAGRLGEAHVLSMLGKRHGVCTEPHIIARLVSTYGAGILHRDAIFGQQERIEESKFEAASQLAPAVAYRGQFGARAVDACAEAEAVLGEDERGWEYAVGLAERGEQGIAATAAAGARLSRVSRRTGTAGS